MYLMPVATEFLDAEVRSTIEEQNKFNHEGVDSLYLRVVFTCPLKRLSGDVRALRNSTTYALRPDCAVDHAEDTVCEAVVRGLPACSQPSTRTKLRAQEVSYIRLRQR